MNIIEKFNHARQEIYDHVGFVEDWVVYAIEDRTEMYYQILNNEVKFAKTLEDFYSDDNYYIDEIYTQIFYKKHIYKGAEFTLIFVNTLSAGGNKFFAIYNNLKEVPYDIHDCG